MDAQRVLRPALLVPELAAPFPAGLARATGRQVVTLLHDEFADANGTSLDAHAIAPINLPATSWTEVNGDLTIVTGNKVRASANYSRGLVDAGTPDVEILATFTMNSQMGIIGRYDDANNYWSVVCQNASVEIVQVTGGASRGRKSAAVTLTNGVQYPIWVRFSATTVTATVNGVTVTFDGCASSATQFGILTVFTSVDSNFTDFKLTTVASPQASSLHMAAGLLAYWAMSESSGARADSVGSYPLADPDAAGYNTGLVYPNAVDMPSAADPQLVCASPGALDFDGQSFTVALWIYSYDWPASNYRPIVSLLSGDTGWDIRIAANGQVPFTIGCPLPTGPGIVHGSELANSAWNCYTMVWDAEAATLRAYTATKNPDTLAWAGNVSASGASLLVGRGDPQATLATNHRLGPLAIWGRALTAAERDQWYNGGQGWEYTP